MPQYGLPWIPVGAGALLAPLAVMTFLWLVHLRLANAGLAELGWAVSILSLTGFYFLVFDGYLPRKIFLMGMVVLWAARLLAWLLLRFAREKKEDPRYEAIRAALHKDQHFKFLFFFQCQAVTAWLLTLPFIAVFMNPSPRISFAEWCGSALWWLGFAGEILADHQIARFKRNPANRHRTCREGLWNYSRHPNYFFEWVIWLSYAIFAMGSPYGWTVNFSALLMLFLLVKVSGIPPSENRALASRGDEYRIYQRTTSPFVPWFKKGER